MAKKFQGKYRTESHRYNHWNYTNDGAYFITLCAKYRDEYFGTITDGKMHLSDIGRILKEEWFRSKDIRSELDLNLDNYVIMPDHFHGIIIIRRRDAKPGVSTFFLKIVSDFLIYIFLFS